MKLSSKSTTSSSCMNFMKRYKQDNHVAMERKSLQFSKPFFIVSILITIVMFSIRYVVSIFDIHSNELVWSLDNAIALKSAVNASINQYNVSIGFFNGKNISNDRHSEKLEKINRMCPNRVKIPSSLPNNGRMHFIHIPKAGGTSMSAILR